MASNLFIATSVMMLFCLTLGQLTTPTCTWRDAPVVVPSVNCQGPLLTVTYNGHDVTCDTLFNNSDVLTATPTLAWPGAVAGKRYLLVMLDPDASLPCTPTRRNIVHWIAYLEGPSLHMTQELSSYHGPHPPVGSAPHRYQFNLFAWDHGNDPDLFGGQRSNFDFDHFKAVNRLGDSLAAFQLQCQRF